MDKLNGRRVLVMRAREQASGLREALLSRGAEVVSIPVIEIVPPTSWEEMDGALAAGERYDWLVLTSANAAQSVAERVGAGQGDFDTRMVWERVAAVGAATARRAAELGLVRGEVLLPERAVAEALAERLGQVLRAEVETRGRVRVLLPRAEQAREVLPEALRAAGAEVRVVTAYRNRVPTEAVERLREVFGHGGCGVDAVAFSSSSSVMALLGALAAAGLVLPHGVRCVSIGEITSRTMRERGLRVDAEAEVAGVDGLVDAVTRATGG